MCPLPIYGSKYSVENLQKLLLQSFSCDDLVFDIDIWYLISKFAGIFLGVKRPGRGVNHPPHLAPTLKKE